LHLIWSVLHCRIGSVSGEFKTFDVPAAYLPSRPGQFTLQLQDRLMTVQVLGLGPLVVASQAPTQSGAVPPTTEYAWVVLAEVGGPQSCVIARDPDTFLATYQNAIQTKLNSLGLSLNGADALQPIFQSSATCNYPAISSH